MSQDIYPSGMYLLLFKNILTYLCVFFYIYLYVCAHVHVCTCVCVCVCVHDMSVWARTRDKACMNVKGPHTRIDSVL